MALTLLPASDGNIPAVILDGTATVASLVLVLALVLTGLSGEDVGSTLALSKLGNGKESNLHTLEHTYYAHEDKENDYGSSWWYTVPQSGLSGEKGDHSDGNTECKDGQREETTGPEESCGTCRARLFFGLYWLTGKETNSKLNHIRCVQKSGELKCNTLISHLNHHPANM